MPFGLHCLSNELHCRQNETELASTRLTTARDSFSSVDFSVDISVDCN